MHGDGEPVAELAPGILYRYRYGVLFFLVCGRHAQDVGHTSAFFCLRIDVVVIAVPGL